MIFKPEDNINLHIVIKHSNSWILNKISELN
jgi:hypothetical protein